MHVSQLPDLLCACQLAEQSCLRCLWHADPLLEQLQGAFAPGSAFWQAHGSQAPHVPFHSYVCPLVGLAAAQSLVVPPRSWGESDRQQCAE